MDANENIITDGNASVFHPTGTDLGQIPDDEFGTNYIEANVGDISAFATISDSSRAAIQQAATADESPTVSIMMTGSLSNVDRKDGSSSTASVGEGMLEIRVSTFDNRESTPENERETLINTGQGSIFAMKRKLEE